MIYLDDGSKKEKASGYTQVGPAYLLPSRIEKNKVSYGRFEFIYERKQRTIKDARFELKEL
jgi:hypothetical protein